MTRPRPWRFWQRDQRGGISVILAGSLFMLAGVFFLVVFPIMLHPTLPYGRKWLLSLLAFFVLVPGGIALYLWLGVPQMAQFS